MNNSKFYSVPLQNSADGNSGLDLNVNTNHIDLNPEYSGFLGIGEGKVKAKLQNIGANIKKVGANVKAEVKRDASKVSDAAKKAADNVKAAEKKAADNIKAAEKKAKDKIAAKAKEFKVKEKAFIAKGKNALHNVADKLKKIPANIRKGVQNVVRKGIRQGVIFRIHHNAHGIATQLAPAISPVQGVSPAYTQKANSAYADILKSWKDLGGNQAEFDAAVSNGSKSAILKNPYPTKVLAQANRGAKYMKPIAKPVKHSFSGENYYGVIDDGTGNIQALSMGTLPVDDISTAELNIPDDTSINSATTPDDLTDPNSAPAQEVQLHGIRAFFAKIKAWFHKHFGHDNPNPYVNPSASVTTPASAAANATSAAAAAQAAQFQSQLNGDAANVPASDEASNPIVDTLTATSIADQAGTNGDATSGIPDSTPTSYDSQSQQDMQQTTPDQTAIDLGAIPNDGSTSDDTIFGMPKMVVYVGAALIVAAALFFGIRAVNKNSAAKSSPKLPKA